MNIQTCVWQSFTQRCLLLSQLRWETEPARGVLSSEKLNIPSTPPDEQLR